MRPKPQFGSGLFFQAWAPSGSIHSRLFSLWKPRAQSSKLQSPDPSSGFQSSGSTILAPNPRLQSPSSKPPNPPDPKTQTPQSRPETPQSPGHTKLQTQKSKPQSPGPKPPRPQSPGPKPQSLKVQAPKPNDPASGPGFKIQDPNPKPPESRKKKPPDLKAQTPKPRLQTPNSRVQTSDLQLPSFGCKVQAPNLLTVPGPGPKRGQGLSR